MDKVSLYLPSWIRIERILSDQQHALETENGIQAGTLTLAITQEVTAALQTQVRTAATNAQQALSNLPSLPDGAPETAEAIFKSVSKNVEGVMKLVDALSEVDFHSLARFRYLTRT